MHPESPEPWKAFLLEVDKLLDRELWIDDIEELRENSKRPAKK